MLFNVQQIVPVWHLLDPLTFRWTISYSGITASLVATFGPREMLITFFDAPALSKTPKGQHPGPTPRLF